MKIISIFQVVISIVLIISILMQNRGSSLGGAFGGGMESFHAKRGFEKFLSHISIALAFLFIALALLNIIMASNA